ncbi:alpha-hydroxy acid oxidase [Xylophilus sp. GOD-11R]|uniref:alpha-hydroxy acid oxidase n=1 Tax=Xylophilus sp. GOD-11R TaxID=3089814 RepID=UPI00298BDEC7|nr:alpha-hydroxy acid oxidase [Xylophilus sp. GOD-11R]WPB59426.1 alpha-hydroxy acid oxidase [Xylophilus sp. GOD-11R]
MRKVFCLEDLEEAARRFLPPAIFSYVVSPAESGATLTDNRAVFDEIRFLPRVLRNVAGRSIATRLLGQDYAAPFGIAPMGVSALTAYRGDRVLAESAARANIPMVMSGSSLTRMEEVARAAPGSWFQAYLPPTPERIAALVDRAARAGFGTLVVTVDVAVRGSTEHYERAGFSSPLQPDRRLLWGGITHPRWALGSFARTLLGSGLPHFENSDNDKRIAIVARNVVREFSGRAHLDWTAMRRIREQWKGKLVLKGVLHPDDAVTARDEGMDAVVLSNHGGRQLDGSVSPMRVLPAVRAAVGPGYPLLIDSGFRRGTDVLKALALGADFVLVGRPFNYAATVGGAAGVAHAAGLLARETEMALGMLGVNRLGELSPALLMLRPETFITTPPGA